MDNIEIPHALLARYPELVQVEKALEQYREGAHVEVNCIKCSGAITVTDVPETGTLVVTCPNGCTRFRAASTAR